MKILKMKWNEMKMKIFLVRFGRMYPLKTITQNASFQKRSPERRFLKTPFSCFGWMNSYFFTYYVTVFDTNKCACSLKRWDSFSPFSSPEPLGLICNEPVESLVSRPRDQETMGSGDENGFSHHCAFVWTGRNDLKTQRLDADFFEHGGENPQLSNKNDYMSSGP